MAGRRRVGLSSWAMHPYEWPGDFPIARPSPRSFMGTAVDAGDRVQGWIYFAGKAADALSTLGGRTFDLVMTDVVMPGRMNGGDLARQILDRWPETKVLATSGYTESALLVKVTLPKGVRFLAKPYSRKELAEALGATLGT